MKFMRTLTLVLLLLKIGMSQGLVEKIVYSSDQSGTYDIWMMNPDGSEQVQLTSDSQNDYGPKISPDGTKIAYLRTGGSTLNDRELRIIDIDGQNDILVIAGVDSFSAWWPDGSKLIYLFATGTCSSDAYMVNLDGTGSALLLDPEQLVVGDQDVSGIEFSENGTEVIWVSQDGCWSPTLEIFKANMVNLEIDASSVIQLTNDSMYDAIGDWSIENGKIVYWHAQGGNGYDSNLFEIYTMDSNGENKTRLSDNSVMDLDSRFSPEGAKIIFVTTAGDYSKIASMNSDGSGVEITTTSSSNERHPDWGYVIVEEPLTVALRDVSALVSSSVLVPVLISINSDSLYRAAELNFSGYLGGLEFIGIHTVGTMISGLDWTWAENEVEGELQTAFAGSVEITGQGVFCYLEFQVVGDICTTVPVNCDYALFNDVEITDITNGSVTIEPIPFYGDVDENGFIQALDASDILMYLVDSLDLDCQTWSNANVYLDSVVDAMDASMILRYLVELEDYLPVTPNEEFLATGRLETEDQEAAPSSAVSIPFNISEGQNIYSFEGEISYDPSEINIIDGEEIYWSPLLDGFMKTVSIDEELGLIHFVGVGANPDGEAGEFLSVNFSIPEGSEIGSQTDVTLEYMKFNSNLILEDIAAHVGVVLSVSGNSLPTSYALEQNYPNPFNPSTAIRYGLPADSHVSLIIYDLRGNTVRTVDSGSQTAGWYEHVWNGMNEAGQPVSTGLYLTRLRAGSYTKTIKMLYLK